MESNKISKEMPTMLIIFGITGDLAAKKITPSLWDTNPNSELTRNEGENLIEGAVEFRKKSQEKPSYTGQAVSAMRHEFGAHDTKTTERKNHE